MSLEYGKGKIFYCSFRGADNWKLNVSKKHEFCSL